ncbi:enoyl reductase [Talaromyces islandicus]|uniref:very-long-chain enoyl-CoA reductase n=1 Tax=Talaromyces islandicus TaxID=28573 RepID=A0A0U1M9J5_TALIS|nr:enoyl reductase [Talaromyces islandicus]
MSTIDIVVNPRGKPIRGLPKEITVSTTSPTSDIYNTLAEKSGYSVHRLRINKGADGSLLSNGSETIQETGLKAQSVVYVKDLGPQLGWRFVYIIEYLGPLAIPPLFLYLLRPYLYFNFEQLADPSQLQVLVCALLVIHFLKREFETIFIHRFSLATMPARNIFKNCGHYWALAGVNIAYWVFRPDSPTATDALNPLLYNGGLALFVFGELANLNAHLILRNLRRPGTTERGIPRGFGFGLVTCPNYMFEIIAWIGIYLLTGLSWSVLLFIVVGTLQMWAWAKKKERRYRQEFGDKYKRYATFFANVSDYLYTLNEGQPRSWVSVPAVRHAMSEYPHSTYFFFLSAHALIMEPRLSLTTHVLDPTRLQTLMIKDQSIVPPDSVIKTFSHTTAKDVELVITQDAEDLVPDSYIIKQGQWARFFLDVWYDPLYRKYNFARAEKHALDHIVQWHATVLAKLALIPQRTINSYSKDSPDASSDGSYHEGDFVIRFNGCDAPGRSCEEEMRPYYSMWQRNTAS